MATYADVKRRTSEILDIPSRAGDRVGLGFDAFIITLILLNTLVVIVETVGDVADVYASELLLFETFTLTAFTLEYFARLWAITSKPQFASPVKGRLRFMVTPYAIVDLLAILPVFAVGLDLRVVRVLRVLRLLKLTKYGESFRTLTNVFRKSARELAMTAFVILIALILASSLMYYAERDEQPDKFSSIPETMWWGIVTLTTTGYGDVVPITATGRLIAGAAVIVGVAAVALPVGILASGFVEEMRLRRNEEKCPHCGEKLRR